MQQISAYEYYAFGFNYALIKAGSLEHSSLDRAHGLLEAFFDKLESLDLPVTQRASYLLKDCAKKIEKGKEGTMGAELAAEIIKEIDKIDAALDAELSLLKAYVLTKKRYPIHTLLNEPNNLCGENVFDKLSVNAQKDFKLACLQIALAQPTAAAFHLMRAAEEQVKVLYFSFKKTQRLKKPMWGPMIIELRKKKTNKPSLKLLDHLDGIRIHFRNPTQHPDAFYSMDEAQDLLNQTVTAINMINAELPNDAPENMLAKLVKARD